MSAQKNKSISIVIPTFNEEGSLEWVVKDTLKNLPKYFKDFEIIIVNDGSTDNTSKIANKLTCKYKNIIVLHTKNNGFSHAMLLGIKKSQKKYVAYMPADGQFLTNDMKHCFEVLDKADLVLGYRGGRTDYTLKRMIMSYGYLMLLAILFNVKYMDVGWVNIWGTKKIQNLKLKGSSGIFILTEIVVKFMNKGYKIIEAPSFYHPRKAGEAKNAKFKVVSDTLLNALLLYIKLRTKHFKKNYRNKLRVWNKKSEFLGIFQKT